MNSRSKGKVLKPLEGNVKVLKRRVVAPENRVRAVFSCDLCKSKKTKCIRSDPKDSAVKVQDKSIPCDSCIKAKVQCVTSVLRRRRVYGSIENLGIHYQTVLSLIQGLYPDIDINDVGELIKLGEELGINMNSHTGNDQLKNIELESKILKPFTPKVNSTISKNYSTPAVISSYNLALPNNSDNNNKHDPNHHYPFKETVFYDSKGGSHYVGSAGTPVLFTVLCNLLLKRSFRNTLSFDKDVELFQNRREHEFVTNRVVYESLFKEPKFPVLKFISKEESLFYLEQFFKFFHPFYFIFDEFQFRLIHDQYWNISVNGSDKELANADVGCIYLVWILGSRLMDHDLRNNSLESIQMDETLKFILTGVSLGSSLNSIQFLFLYAIYLHANKNRDASWNLIGLAIRQSISLGMHRKMIKRSKEADLQTQVFWSLYQYESTLCSTFGRPSTINEDEVDIDYPDLSKNDQVTEEFKNYFVASLKLSKFLNKIVKDRKNLSDVPISLINIERTLNMKNQLNQIKIELRIKKLNEIENIFDFKLSLRYHYYTVALTLPFLLYITTTNFKVKEDETLLSIIKTGIQSAVMVSKLMKLSLKRGFNYGALSTDCMYGYSSILVLSLFFIYLSNTSNDMNELILIFDDEIEESTDKTMTLEHISTIIDYLHNCKLDSTMKRILEVSEGIRNDLKLVEIQDDLKFDTLNFVNDQVMYDSLFTSNEIYLDNLDVNII